MLRPMSDNVMLQVEGRKDEMTAGGIIIPDTSQKYRADEKSLFLKVAAVGPGRCSHEGVVLPMEVQVGQIAIIPKFTGVTVNIDQKEYKIVTEREIIGVLNGEV